MPKKCTVDGCSNLIFGKGYCSYHQFLRPHKATTVKPKKWIAPISIKQAERLKEYRKLRDFYLADHPFCECGGRIPGCTKLSEDLHHSRGRNAFLCDITTFKALSRHCHRYVEEHPLEAKQMGLSLERY